MSDNFLKIRDGGEHRFSFGAFVDRIFWTLMLSVATYGAAQLRDVGRNINELNEKMAVVLERLGNSDHRTETLERRLDRLEKNYFRGH